MVAFVLLFTIINLSQSYRTPNVSAGFLELLVKIPLLLVNSEPSNLCFQLPPVDFVKPLSGTWLTTSYLRDVSEQQRQCCCNQLRTRLLLNLVFVVRWILPTKHQNTLKQCISQWMQNAAESFQRCPSSQVLGVKKKKKIQEGSRTVRIIKIWKKAVWCQMLFNYSLQF